jgi:hypothetical protein
MNDTHHVSYSGGMLLDVSIGLMLNIGTVFFAFISYAQIETALLMGSLSGMAGVLTGVFLRKVLRIVSTWQWRRHTKKDAYIAELESRLKELEKQKS